MSTHIITFHENGHVEHTRTAALDGLLEGERKDVKRMTDILFHERSQLFYIRFLRGPFANHELHWVGNPEPLQTIFTTFSNEHSVDLVTEKCVYIPFTALEPVAPVFFREYEDAVAVEIAFVDYLRELGYSMT